MTENDPPLDAIQQEAVEQMLARGELRRVVVDGKEQLELTRKGRRAMSARIRQQHTVQ